MDDYSPCPRCGDANARCACPKGVSAPLASAAERQALADSVMNAVRAKEA